MVKAWTLLTTLVGRLINTMLGFGNRTLSITTPTRNIAVSSPEGFPPNQYDIVRITSFDEGARAMKDKIIADVTWFADDAPNKESANHMWEMLTHLMQVTVTPEGKQR